MIEQLKKGVRQLEDLACRFASKQRLEIERLMVVGGHLAPEKEQLTLELTCGGKKALIDVATRDIASCSVTAQHKLIMAIMKFVPVGEQRA